ncbi:MAG: beta-ketoacyl-[acyl-carrier-protein] synthase family protein [Thermodesulfobacteriota bacterium]
MSLNRVAITGRGAISPFGLDVEALVENIWAGRSAVRLMPQWRQIKGLKSLLAAPVPEFDPKKMLPRSARRTMGPMAIYATLAAREAIKDAALSPEQLASGTTGVAIGSSTGSPSAYEDFYSRFLPQMATEQIKSGEFFKMMGHSCAANVAQALGINGEQWAAASACTSAAQSIGLGYLMVQTGRQGAMVCGGADEVHSSVTGVFDLLKAASVQNDDPPHTPRPFDLQRDGVVCGGGSGIVVLENLDQARQRGARIYGEIIGFGNVTDSSHIANPHEESMARAMTGAMREAGLQPGEIDYINAHATGTEQGDRAEAAAIKLAVNGEAPVSSFKGHIGHTLGAAGSLELIILLEMLERQEIVPTLNLQEADPACAVVNLVTEIKKQSLKTVLKNNFALGGVNAALAIRRIDS